MIFGFSKFGPEQVVARLRNARQKDIQIIGFGKFEEYDPNAKHVILMDWRDYVANSLLLRQSQNSIYVFAPAFELKRWGIDTEDSACESIMDIDLKSKRPRPPILPRGQRPLNVVLDRVQQCALLGKLMDAIYNLPSKSGQKPVTMLCCQWLDSTDTLEQLDEKLRKLIKKDVVRFAIMKQMRRDLVEDLRSAIRDHHAGMTIDDAADKYGVRAYEISYVLGSLKRKQNATDVYVANVGTEE